MIKIITAAEDTDETTLQETFLTNKIAKDMYQFRIYIY